MHNYVQIELIISTINIHFIISGCGKTTFLAAISQRLRGGTLSGQIRFNGEVVDRTRMTKMSGFLPQSDVILDGITIREHFYFMVSL